MTSQCYSGLEDELADHGNVSGAGGELRFASRQRVRVCLGKRNDIDVNVLVLNAVKISTGRRLREVELVVHNSC